MINNQPIHILNQMGVMTSFSVAKKITDEDMHKYFSKQKRTGKSEAQIGAMLQEKILSEIQEAVNDNKIPGLITPQELDQSLGINKKVIDKIPDLNRIVMVLVHRLSEKKYDKMSLCYFINSLVNMLGLQEIDFQKFHNQNGGDDEGEEYKNA